MALVVIAVLSANPVATVGRVEPLWFSGPPSGRWWNRSEEQLILRHRMVVVGVSGGVSAPGAPHGTEAQLAAQIQRLHAAAKAAGLAPPPMYVYRNGLEALPNYAAVATAVANASLDYLWVRNSSAPGSPVVTKAQPSLGGWSRFYDWRNPATQAWFARTVIAEVAGEEGVAGVFFDEADWATCGAGGRPRGFMQHACDPAWSASDAAAFAAGQASGWTHAGKALAAAGKRMALSLLTARASNRGGIDNYTCTDTEAPYFQRIGQPTTHWQSNWRQDLRCVLRPAPVGAGGSH